MAGKGSQEHAPRQGLIGRFPVLARLKGLANGVNPRWGSRTVVVSKSTGEVLWSEERGPRRGGGR